MILTGVVQKVRSKYTRRKVLETRKTTENPPKDRVNLHDQYFRIRFGGSVTIKIANLCSSRKGYEEFWQNVKNRI